MAGSPASRRGDRLLLAVVVLVLVVLPLWMLDISVPRRIRSVTGTVVMFQTTADESEVEYSLTVRLDSGKIAHATNGIRAVAVVGARVELSESTGLLSGIRRYRLQRLLTPMGSVGLL